MKSQEGFTVVELMVALIISLVTIFAGFQALDGFRAISATTTVRSDNTQRARLAMDGLIRALRSQACKGPGEPSLLAGGPTSVAFITDLGDGTTVPERREVTYDAPTRTLQERRFAGSRSGTTLAFASTPTSFGPELAGVEPTAGRPVFGFYGYDTSNPPRPVLPLGPTLTGADLARVSRITVEFRVGAAAGEPDQAAAATLQDEVFLRSVDPADPVPLPLCA
ncbi:MAG: hypothetical protein JWO90_3035 [Solirubrobacterales bacterium]|nr:hypothetical protein [Solirubrobacterales bacterium]